MVLIDCDNASFAYEGNVVIKDLSFKINSGDYLCIVGENGSGKSTLIKGLLALKHTDSGKILYMNDLKSKEIGYLPQQTIVQKDFPAGVFEVVLSGCANKLGRRFFYNKNEKKIARDNILLLGVDKIQNKCYRELSGGQQQRVLLARAMCSTNKIMILDEPVTGLDPIATKDLYNVIKKINREENITIIMVSHDIKSVMKDSTHILHLKNNQYFYGKTEEYKNSDIGKFFLEVE